MSQPDQLPELPVLDEALCMEAERLATGARIHDAMADIGTYRNSVDGAQRLAGMMKGGKRWPTKPGEMTAEQDLAKRIDLAKRYAVKLQAFVVRQRLAAG